MSKILELRNKRSKLWEDTKNFLEEHRDANGLVEASAVEQYDKMANEVKALGDEIKRLEDQMALDAQLSAATSAPVHTDVLPKAKKANMPKTATPEYNDAFWNMMRGNVTNEVLEGLSVGTDEKGGYTVPDEFEHRLIQGLEENNVFRRIAHVMRTNSGTRTIPIAMDNGTASWIEEGAAIQESDLNFSIETLSAYKLGCMIKITNELLHDSAFDLPGYIAQRFGVRFGNAEEDAFINGTGQSADPAVPSMPTGILTSVNATAQTTTADASHVDFDNIYKLYYALKSPYRRKASFLCNETLLLQLMLLKDGNGNYIWKPGLEVGEPDRILGHPIHTSAYMPAITGTAAQDKNKKVLLFGDFDYYWIADRTNRTMKRLNELYAVTDQVGFIGTQRVDGKLILPEAMKVMALGNK